MKKLFTVDSLLLIIGIYFLFIRTFAFGQFSPTTALLGLAITSVAVGMLSSDEKEKQEIGSTHVFAQAIAYFAKGLFPTVFFSVIIGFLLNMILK